jgi:hypothetical protein
LIIDFPVRSKSVECKHICKIADFFSSVSWHLYLGVLALNDNVFRLGCSLF